MRPKLPKVLYIAGSGRSGSTLMEVLLGRLVPGAFAAGEISGIWSDGFIENNLCCCGRPLQQCDFWVAVVQRAFGGWRGIDPHRMLKLWLSLSRMRNEVAIGLRIAAHRTTWHAELRELSAVWHSLYAAIQAVSGCRTIIDSSKVPLGVRILSELKAFDTYTLHLVRDGRAVAYSMQRKKLRPEFASGAEYMPRHNPVFSALHWVFVNLMVSRQAKECRHYRCVQYRDLVAQPQAVLSEVAAFVGERAVHGGWTDERVIQLSENHTLSGNPMRFKRGQLKIISDDEWRAKMPRSQRFLVTAITSPLLWHYGYLRPGKAG